MFKYRTFTLGCIILLLCGILSCRKQAPQQQSLTATDPEDASQFVTLTDVVPDAILEIRYYGTYNFVGKRIPRHC